MERGFSVSNLQFMRRFYQNYQIQQTVSLKSSGSSAKETSGDGIPAAAGAAQPALASSKTSFRNFPPRAILGGNKYYPLVASILPYKLALQITAQPSKILHI